MKDKRQRLLGRVTAFYCKILDMMTSILFTTPRRRRGFTLIELMIVVAVVAILAAVAMPSYLQSVQKSRRADAIARIAQLQQAQERWRASNATYGTLADTGVPATVTGGFYQLDVVPPSTAASAPFFYDAAASAVGSQLRDSNCIWLRARYDRGAITLSSGPDNTYGNGLTANNRCWNR